jgi:glycosyltransferase involved in cell wall biosynthesis
VRALRIGIDARELCGHATGVGRYLGGLLREWQRHAGSVPYEFILYAAEPIPQSFVSPRFRPRIVGGASGTWWEQARLPSAAAADDLDVFFAPAYTMALRLAVPTVVAIHDISFVAHPEWFGVREGLRRRWLTRQSAARARTVITISEFSRQELLQHLDLAPDRIQVIPPGIDKGDVPEGPHTGGVLYVGSIFNRRHVPDLVRAFAPIARAHASVTLDIVGDNRTHPHQDIRSLIAHEQLESRARWRAYVPEDNLRALYRSARAFAFPSEYEGLGLTPLEGLAVGVPPVLLDTAVARESCGAAALYVRANDLRGLTAAIETLLFDETARHRLLEAAPSVLARYDWAMAGQQTLAAIVAAAGQRVIPPGAP